MSRVTSHESWPLLSHIHRFRFVYYTVLLTIALLRKIEFCFWSYRFFDSNRDTFIFFKLFLYVSSYLLMIYLIYRLYIVFSTILHLTDRTISWLVICKIFIYGSICFPIKLVVIMQRNLLVSITWNFWLAKFH